MIPFKLFDKNEKITWIVLNYQNTGKDGQYLIAREDDSDLDGEIKIVSAEELTNWKLLGFVQEHE